MSGELDRVAQPINRRRDFLTLRVENVSKVGGAFVIWFGLFTHPPLIFVLPSIIALCCPLMNVVLDVYLLNFCQIVLSLYYEVIRKLHP